MRARAMSVALVALVGTWSTGCDDDAPPTPAATAATPQPMAGLEASLGGKPIPVTHAVAMSRGGRALQVAMSTHAISCRDAVRGIQRERGELAIDMTVAPLLQPDGKESWRAGRMRIGGITRRGDLGSASLDEAADEGSGEAVAGADPAGAAAAAGKTVRIAVTAEMKIPPSAPGEAMSSLLLKGGFDAVDCGVLPWDTRADVKRQDDLEVTIAGKSIPIYGASVKGREVRLSSQGHSCAVGMKGSDFAIELALEPPSEGDAGHVSAIRIDGLAMPRLVHTKLEPGKLSAVAEGEGVVFDGSASVGGYPVTLRGQIGQLPRCPVE